MESLAGTLDTIREHLSSALVPPAAYARVARAASRLPAALTRWIYLERHLGGGEPRVDLIVGVERGDAEQLVDGRATRSIGGMLAFAPAWRRVRALCGRWRDHASPLHDAVERIWLEFDLADEEAAIVLLPGVFVDFTEAASADASPENRLALLEAALEPLLDGPVPDATARALRRALTALPAGARMVYLGLLLPRGGASVRICLAGLDERTLPAFLRDAGWPGSADAIAETLESLATVQPRTAVPNPVAVHLDVADEVLPAVGLEYAFTRAGQARGALAEVPFLDHLAELGLCTAGERDGMVAWPGASVEMFPHELWQSIAVRRLNHVKVMCGADGRPAAAKAYGYLHYAIRPPRPEGEPAGSAAGSMDVTTGPDAGTADQR